MKNILLYGKFLIISLILCAVSCSSCAKKNQTTAPIVPTNSVVVPIPAPPIVPSANDLVRGDNWSFLIPSDWTRKPILEEPYIVALFGNEEKQDLVILIKEKFSGDIEQYAVGQAQSLGGQGAEITELSQVEINGTEFIVVGATLGDLSVWEWIAVKDNYGYAFNCGGKSSDIKDLCLSIMHSFRIATLI